MLLSVGGFVYIVEKDQLKFIVAIDKPGETMLGDEALAANAVGCIQSGVSSNFIYGDSVIPNGILQFHGFATDLDADVGNTEVLDAAVHPVAKLLGGKVCCCGIWINVHGDHRALSFGGRGGGRCVSEMISQKSGQEGNHKGAECKRDQ